MSAEDKKVVVSSLNREHYGRSATKREKETSLFLMTVRDKFVLVSLIFLGKPPNLDDNSFIQVI